MALATYADLQAAIAAYLARPGDANITGPAPDFIALAESRIAYGGDAPFQSRPLRIRAMETTAVLTTVAGQDSLALPAGYLQMRSIFIQGAPERQLSPVTPEAYHSTHLGGYTAKPRAYVLEGDSTRFGPVPDAAYAVQMGFYKKFTALSDGQPTNWLLTNKPDVYLHGSLLEAAIFLGDDEGAQRYFGLYRGAVEGVQNADMADRYSGAALQMRSGVMGA